jgi:hypothetical protein
MSGRNAVGPEGEVPDGDKPFAVRLDGDPEPGSPARDLYGGRDRKSGGVGDLQPQLTRAALAKGRAAAQQREDEFENAAPPASILA